MGDASDDGLVTFADVTRVLATFGLFGCPPPSAAPYFADGDADRNGDRDFADVTAVLANFGPPAPTYCLTSGQSIRSSGDGFVEMDLDRTEEPMTQAEAVMTITQALNQMGYASIEAFGDAIAQMDEETRNAEIRRLGELLEGIE